MFRAFATIRIFSKDVAASRGWYRAFFGVDPTEDLPGFVSFKIADTCFDISAADEKSPYSPGGGVGYWLVDDLGATLARAQALGARIYRGPLRVEEAQRTIAQIQDSLGNVIGLEAEF